MTREQFIEKYANGLVGLIHRFLLQDMQGGGTFPLRAVVRQVEAIVGQMYDVSHSEPLKTPNNQPARKEVAK